MKKVYLVKKNPEAPAEKDNWTVMNGYEFAMFMKTPEGIRRSKSFGRLDGCGKDDLVIIAECGIDMAKEWQIERDHKVYLDKFRKRAGYTVFSYQGIENESGDGLTGEDLLLDENMNTEETVIFRLMQESLKAAVLSLTPEDQDLIEKLFLADHPLTELEYADSIGSSRNRIHDRKRTVLRKLRTILLNQV